MPTDPLVSIIIPTYNRAQLIGETLDSVLAQTYSNWECIVVDDGSTDNTDEVLKTYCDKDARFKYVHRSHTHKPGGNGARNYGFIISKGDYVNWFDSDDLMHPEKLERQVEKIINKPCTVATCMWGKFDKSYKDTILNEKPYFKDYSNALFLLEDIGKYGGYLPCHAYLVDKKIISLSGLWNEKLNINQDGEFFCRVLINSKGVYFVENVFVYYRMATTNNVSQNISNKKIEQRIKSWKLIENHLYDKYSIKYSGYVETAKKGIFRLLKNNKSFLIYKYYVFFWNQHMPNKIFRKLKLK